MLTKLKDTKSVCRVAATDFTCKRLLLLCKPVYDDTKYTGKGGGGVDRGSRRGVCTRTATREILGKERGGGVEEGGLGEEERGGGCTRTTTQKILGMEGKGRGERGLYPDDDTKYPGKDGEGETPRHSRTVHPSLTSSVARKPLTNFA